jgi:hypothetical protein
MALEYWQSVLGTLLIPSFSLLGMKLVNDNRFKMISFGTGVASSAVFAGLNVTDVYTQAADFVSKHADMLGIATGTTTLLLSTLSPIKSLRNTGLAAGFTGITTSIFGNPGWIGFAIWAGILTVLGVVAYKIIQKIVHFFNTKNKQFKNYYDSKNNLN